MSKWFITNIKVKAKGQLQYQYLSPDEGNRKEIALGYEYSQSHDLTIFVFSDLYRDKLVHTTLVNLSDPATSKQVSVKSLKSSPTRLRFGTICEDEYVCHNGEIHLVMKVKDKAD